MTTNIQKSYLKYAFARTRNGFKYGRCESDLGHNRVNVFDLRCEVKVMMQKANGRRHKQPEKENCVLQECGQKNKNAEQFRVN